MPLSPREIFSCWQNVAKTRQPVDNSVDEIILDPISTAVCTHFNSWSFFVHMNKKPLKQGFAGQMRTAPQNGDRGQQR
jgi:hypothetical protein